MYIILSILVDLKPRFYFKPLLPTYILTEHTGKLFTDFRNVSLFYIHSNINISTFLTLLISLNLLILLISRQMYMFILKGEKHGIEKYLLNLTGEELVGQNSLTA